MITKEDITIMDHRVCEAIDISLDRLFWIKLHNGCEFLRAWIGDRENDSVKTMEVLPEYWAWWQQIWYNEDKRYLHRFKYRRLESYLLHHNPENIAYRPNSVVFESYHQLIKELRLSEIQN